MGAAGYASDSQQAQLARDGGVQAVADGGIPGDCAEDGDLPGGDGGAGSVWAEVSDHEGAGEDHGEYGDRADGDGDGASVVDFAGAGSRCAGEGAERIQGRFGEGGEAAGVKVGLFRQNYCARVALKTAFLKCRRGLRWV